MARQTLPQATAQVNRIYQAITAVNAQDWNLSDEDDQKDNKATTYAQFANQLRELGDWFTWYADTQSSAYVPPEE